MANKLAKIQAEAPKILANEGQNYFSQNFAKQQWNGNKWADVKRRIPGTFEYKYPKRKFISRRTNPILVGRTRRLKNTLPRSAKEANKRRIKWALYGEVGNYGAIQNYGNGKIKARKFMGVSPEFQRRLKNKYEQIVRVNLR